MENTDISTSNVKLARYVAWYLLIFIGILVVMGSLKEAIQFDLGGVSIFVPTILSAMIVGFRFAKKESRALVGGEKWKLAFFCVASIYVLLVSILGAIFMMSDQKEGLVAVGALSAGVIVIGSLIAGPIQFGVTGLFLGIGAKQAAPKGSEKIEKVFD